MDKDVVKLLDAIDKKITEIMAKVHNIAVHKNIYHFSEFGEITTAQTYQ